VAGTTDPLDADSDADGLLDGAEVNIHGTDPNDPDSDNDTLTDGAEVLGTGTDPNDPDSDNDGFDDATEVAAGSDPNDPASTPPREATIVVRVPDTTRDAVSVINHVRRDGFSAPGDHNDYISNDGDQESAAFAFPLDIPRGAEILSARVELWAAPYQAVHGDATADIHVYNVANVAPFQSGNAGDLITHAPTHPAVVRWAPRLGWSTNSIHQTAELRTLVQAIVNRGDWSPGNHMGFVITEGNLPNGIYYGWRDHAHAANMAPRITVTFNR